MRYATAEMIRRNKDSQDLEALIDEAIEILTTHSTTIYTFQDGTWREVIKVESGLYTPRITNLQEAV